MFINIESNYLLIIFLFYIYIYIFIIIHVIPSLYAVVIFLMKLKKYHTDEQLTYNE